ncbi:hypothetical protein Syun_007831 [Stephania yunnanensis]|uniref:DNA polymerase n=1 Tax=Stephania yunnanensis TaxID=152371 RepID=A0AAP0L1S4_9MAGN
MADSQSESTNIFSVRIVSIDFYMAPPIPDLDICYSSFQGGEAKEVPVIRIYGSTPAGQKTCLHVHRALPYLYVPCSDFSFKTTEEADARTHAMALAIEKALTLKASTGSKRQHVHSCTLVRAKKFYGYHSSEELFMKIHLYYPHEVARVAGLLLGGAILDKSSQPHESHIPYLLQFLVDYNLFGMGLLHASMVKFRHPLPKEFTTKGNRFAGQPRHSGEAFTCRSADCKADSSANECQDFPIWTSSTVTRNWLWQFPNDTDGSQDQDFLSIKRQSASELEGDATVDDIINQQAKMYSSLSQTQSDVKMVQSLVPIWEEEYERTGLREEVILSDPEKPPPEEVLRSFSHGPEFETVLLGLCRVARNSSPLSTSKEVEKSKQSIKSVTYEGNSIELGVINTRNPNGCTSSCSKERSEDIKPLDGSLLGPDDALPSQSDIVLAELQPIEMEMVIDKEALRLLRWLSSSQAQEDLNTGDELVHDIIPSPYLAKAIIDEVTEESFMDYEHESQKECQDILDSVEVLADPEKSKEGATDHVIAQAGNFLGHEVNCDLERCPQKTLKKNKKRLRGSSMTLSQQMVNNDAESPNFADTLSETKMITQSKSYGSQINNWHEDSEFKPKPNTSGLREGNELAESSMRDLIRRKHCSRIKPSKNGTCNNEKFLLGEEHGSTRLRLRQDVFDMRNSDVEAVMPVDVTEKSLIAEHDKSGHETTRPANCSFFMHPDQQFSPTLHNMQFGFLQTDDDVLHVGVAPKTESITVADFSLNPEKEKLHEPQKLAKSDYSTLAGCHKSIEVKEKFGFSSKCLMHLLKKDILEGSAPVRQLPEICSNNANVPQPLHPVSVEVQTEGISSDGHRSFFEASVSERVPTELVEMTLSKRPPLINWSGDTPDYLSVATSMNDQKILVGAGKSKGTFDWNSSDLGTSTKDADVIPPFFMEGVKVEKHHYEHESEVFPFHHETVLGVPTHYQNDGSFAYLLTTVFSPPTLDSVKDWLSHLALQNESAGTSRECTVHPLPEILPNSSSFLNKVNEPFNKEITGSEIEHIGSWQDVSQISGPDPSSKLTPLSQMGFHDPASVGGGQQLTLISLEVLAQSRGDLRPDPRFDAVNVIALVIQEDDNDILDSFVLLRGDVAESCESKGILNCKVIVASDEEQLFNDFVKIVISFDPDILMGWEIQGGSLGYLAERAAYRGIVLLSCISRIHALEANSSKKSAAPVKERPGHLLPEASLANPIVVEDAVIEDEWGRTHASGVHVAGRIVLNIWRLMRGEVKLKMYSIEAVAEEVLRRKIPSIPFRVLTFWFSNGHSRARYRCIEYTVERAKLNLEIMNQLDMINRTSELARIFGIDFFSVLSRGSQYRVESMLLRLAHTQNYLAVSPGNQQVASQPAMECLPLVMEPESGFYADPVVVLDFQSLYPSMVIAYNLCFSTCVGKAMPSKPNILGVSSYSPDPQILMDMKDHILFTPNGVMYAPSKVRRGVLPRMLEEILSTRIMVKKAMKKLLPSQKVLTRIFNSRQLALKLIANVTYGYTAAGFSGRMPCAELADSIVQCGRRTLEKAIALVNSHDKWNARVIYGDTDSMFVLLEGRTLKESFKIGQEMASEVTSMNPDPVTLKMEKVYHPCFLLTKKRYVGYSYENPDQAEPSFDAKGIETVRRDSCGVVAKTMEKSLRLFFEHQDISKVKEYLLRQWTKILGGRASLQDFVFAKEVRLGTYAPRASSLPPAAIVATKAMRADPRCEPRYAERIPYVVIHGEPGARLVDMVVDPLDLLAIDSPYRLNDLYYINKQIIPALQRVFGLVGADLNQWFSEMPRPVRPTVSKRHSYAPNAQRTRIDYYYISKHCVLCGELVQASMHLCDKCSRKGPAAATAVICRTAKLERDIQHLFAICGHCGGADWIAENGVKCESLACGVFYERRKVQKELQAFSAVASELGLYPSLPRCLVEWF